MINNNIHFMQELKSLHHMKSPPQAYNKLGSCDNMCNSVIFIYEVVYMITQTYLVEWKWKHVGRCIYFPIGFINLLNPTVVHADDAQVKLLDAKYVSQSVHIPP